MQSQNCLSSNSHAELGCEVSLGSGKTESPQPSPPRPLPLPNVYVTSNFAMQSPIAIKTQPNTKNNDTTMICNFSCSALIKVVLSKRMCSAFYCLRREYCLINSPGGHLCTFIARFADSAGPCSRHRKLHISEINSDQGQISKQLCNISGKFPPPCNLFSANSKSPCPPQDPF